MIKEKINWAQRYREDYNKNPLKGFINDGFGNSVSDEEAKKLEDKYFDKWIIVDDADISRGKLEYYLTLAKVVSLYWSDSPRGGNPFKLQIDYVKENETDVHPTYEHNILHIFGKDRPSDQETERIMNSLESLGYRRKNK